MVYHKLSEDSVTKQNVKPTKHMVTKEKTTITNTD